MAAGWERAGSNLNDLNRGTGGYGDWIGWRGTGTVITI
jgi:hypothetical protein